LTATDALGQEVVLECLGGPCDGEWVTHDRLTLVHTRPSVAGEGSVTSVYQASPRLTPRGLTFVWLHLGDR
jgi:hypothetical protein